MANVLIVDDEIENLSALKRALGDKNPDWVVFTAQGDVEGSEIIVRQLEIGEPIDVLLTDLVMGEEESGMNLLRSARQCDPFLMTILFTAKEKSLNRYTAFDYGAFDVVEKNILGASAVEELNIKTRAALRYKKWNEKVNLMRKYFDPRVFDLLEREPALLMPSRRVVTVVFWDIRGFSSVCESLKAHPDLIAGFLKEYFGLGAEVIFKNNGVLDKFIGDGIMALFGALNHKDDEGKSDALLAITSAKELNQRFSELLARWVEKWKLYTPDEIKIGLGCGIHTGEAIVGNLGPELRDQFTAVGSAVNFASRIENRADAGEILVSQPTETRVKGKVSLTPAGKIDDVKNIQGSFPIFRVN